MRAHEAEADLVSIDEDVVVEYEMSVVSIEHRVCGGRIDVMDDGSFVCPNCGPLAEVEE